jgi:SAM-dependent methyltransferase
VNLNDSLDNELANRYGAYASFSTPHDPILVETFGDGPADEMDRLLDRFITSDTRVLELGCGAGQSLCRLAPKAADYWGVDLEEPLLNGARERMKQAGVSATLLLGDTTFPETVAQLPDAHFDFSFSRRGPFLTAPLMKKLTPDALFLVEMWQSVLGINEILGQTSFLPSNHYGGSDGAVQHQAGLGMQPVSVRHFYFNQYFRDADHLEAFLGTAFYLHRGYERSQDRDALELYARYNTTPKGVRMMQHRKIYLFRRENV